MATYSDEGDGRQSEAKWKAYRLLESQCGLGDVHQWNQD